MSILPISYVNSYNDLFYEPEQYEFSGIPAGSKITLSFSIKCLSFDYDKFQLKKARQAVIEFLSDKINNIYNDKKIHLGIKLELTPGCINFNFEISLEVLAKMDYTRLKLIVGSIILCIGMVCGTLIVNQHIENSSNKQIQNMNYIDKQKDRELLISLFNNEKLSLSGEDTAKIMTGYFDKTINKNLILIQDNPFKKVFADVPKGELQLSDLTINNDLLPPDEQDNATKQDEEQSPKMSM